VLSGLRARAQREIALSVETFWRPYHPRTMMAVELSGSGVSAGGVHVVEHTERRKFLAQVLVTNACETITEGDFILFEDGTQEPLRSIGGDEFVVIREDMVTDIIDGYQLAVEAPLEAVP
jgi:hypothetical protein